MAEPGKPRDGRRRNREKSETDARRRIGTRRHLPEKPVTMRDGRIRAAGTAKRFEMYIVV